MDFPERRVAITGIGVVAPNGQDLETFWRTIVDGVSAAGPVTRFDTQKLPTKIACEVKGFDPLDHFDRKTNRRLDLSLKYGIVASLNAVKDASLDTKQLNPDRFGVVEGTSMSNNEGAFKAESTYTNKGYRYQDPFLLFNAYCGAGSGEIALHLGCHGHVITICTGSASGNDAIGQAVSMIKEDELDVAVAGGADANLLAPTFGVFCRTKVMTTSNDVPERAMKPFDRHRDGFLLGEGAVYLVLEELSFALARNARIYAELVSHGRSCEAYHAVAPHPEGVGIREAMARTLRKARMMPCDIDYVNLHGTATDQNDRSECRAIQLFFGGEKRKPAIGSTKPVTGHLLGASGALEAAVCALAIHRAVIPPTLNLEQPEEGFEDLNFAPTAKRSFPIRAVLNLNSGFGGKNSCLLLRKFE